MDGENRGCMCSGILLGHKKETLCCGKAWMNLEGILLSEISQTLEAVKTQPREHPIFTAGSRLIKYCTILTPVRLHLSHEVDARVTWRILTAATPRLLPRPIKGQPRWIQASEASPVARECGEVKNPGFGVRTSHVKPCICHIPGRWPWPNDLTVIRNG